MQVVAHPLLMAASSNTKHPGGVSGWLLHFHGPPAYALVGFLAFAEAAVDGGVLHPR